MKKTLATIFFLFCISLPTVFDLFKPGAYTSHDITHHIVRLVQMDRIIREGQIPARWTGNLNMGYGYPLFMFNYPLPQYLGEVFHLLGANFVWSIKYVFIFSLLASIFPAYLFFSSLWGRRAGIVGAVFYLYAPIRFINVYVSATIGNALAFVFVPLPFYAVVRLIRKPDKRSLALGSLGLAGLLLSHNIMAFIFLIVFGVFSVPYLIRDLKKSTVTAFFLMVFFGFGISAFFWLPAVVEKQYIRYDQILKGFYLNHYPTVRQLLYSPWGYGFSWPGDNNDNPGRMSNQIGLAHVFVIGLYSLVLIWSIKKRSFSWLGLFFFATFWIVFFLMLKISSPIWSLIPWMAYIQMPWRLLAVSIFCAAGLASYLSYKVKSPLFSVLLIILVILANRNHLRINQIFDPGELYFTSITGTTTMAGEHLPHWGMQRNKPAPAAVEFLSGKGRIHFTKSTAVEHTFVTTIDTDAELLFNHYFFPGWQVIVDDHPYAFTYKSNDADLNGLIRFSLPPGRHLVYLRFTKTTVRQFADLWSFIMIVVLLLWLVKSNQERQVRV